MQTVKTVKLGEICKINPTRSSAIDENESVSFLSMADVSEEGTISNEQERKYGLVKKGFTYFEQGDVLIAKITPCFENGKGAITSNLTHQIGFGSTEFHVIRPTEFVETKYLFYLTRTPEFKTQGKKNMTGSAGQQRVPANFLQTYPVPLPDLDTQRHIAAVLDRADALRQKDRQLLTYYEQLPQAVFLEMFGDPVRNEKGWERGTIRDVVTEVKYGTSKPAENGGTYPYLRMNNITYSGRWDLSDLKYINLDDVEESKYLAHKGDLLFNRTNSRELVGKTAVYGFDYPMAIAGYLIKARINEKAAPEYVAAYLNSKHGKATLQNMCKSIIGMANINAQELQNIQILIPPIELQNQYVAAVREMEAQVQKMVNQLATSEKLFQSLLHESFSGKG